MRNLTLSFVICSFAFAPTVGFAKSSKQIEKTVFGQAQKTAGSDRADANEFHKLYDSWTDAFNKKDLQGSCNLFSPELIADYQGAPTKTLASMHDGLKKVFADEHVLFRYKYKLHDIYRSGNLAAVRITWYLTVTEDGKPPRETVDQGLDVLKKGKDGKWKIVNYIAYQDKQDTK